MPSKIRVGKRAESTDIMKFHPCFSLDAHKKFGRIHLPVAPFCNIHCSYCIRKYDCGNESRPGITSAVLSPDSALERVRCLLKRNECINVIGIAGPGDPLANETTFEVLSSIKKEYPEIILCLSTNGLLLADKLEDILEAGVRSITITINAVLPKTAAQIYSWISYRGRRYNGESAAELLLSNQWKGLYRAKEAGLAVKVNSVYIPGINDKDLPFIALQAGKKRADIMNIIPLVPQAAPDRIARPSHEMLKAMRERCGKYLSQMTHCRQCRADAFGILREDRDMGIEVFNARIGEKYCGAVH